VSLDGARIGLITSSASRLNGGVFEAVVAQAGLIAAAGGRPVVFAVRDEHSDEDRQRFAGADVHLVDGWGPRQIGYAPDLVASLLSERLDCLHLHGIWMYPSAAATRWARVTGRPYYISPHGMLDPWITARGTWKKAAARLAYERRSWRAATALHALTSAEAADIARESARTDTIVIPNAVAPGPAPGAAVMPPPNVVYIGRIHPKKNLSALVRGWSAAQFPAGAQLVIAGWGDDEAIAGLRHAVAQGPANISFVGPQFGAAKDKLLDEARFVVLPSLSEGLPMAILEAWARGVPTIMTTACNLPEGFDSTAAIECGLDAPAISQALQRAMALDESEWQAMRGSALALAENRFSPVTVGAQWSAVYRAALEGSRR